MDNKRFSKLMSRISPERKLSPTLRDAMESLDDSINTKRKEDRLNRISSDELYNDIIKLYNEDQERVERLMKDRIDPIQGGEFTLKAGHPRNYAGTTIQDVADSIDREDAEIKRGGIMAGYRSPDNIEDVINPGKSRYSNFYSRDINHELSKIRDKDRDVKDYEREKRIETLLRRQERK